MRRLRRSIPLARPHDAHVHALCCMAVLTWHPTAQATVTTTRTGDETFRVEMTGAVGGKVLAFDVAVALHA